MSDAVHDMGDAAGIGAAYFLEKKAKKQPDDIYTYGYERYSLLGGLITTVILISGSVVVILSALRRLLNPVEIDYSGMIIFAALGVVVNFIAAWFTREGDSVNQRAVNLHMIEDVLGWVLVLIGGVIMKFTDFAMIDSLLSMGVAVFILINALKNLKEILDVFLEKIPDGIDIASLKEHILEIDGVLGVHHIHIRTVDGQRNYATMHIVTEEKGCEIKRKVREELAEHNISHTTLELEHPDEKCEEETCRIDSQPHKHHHHHHHH